LTAETRVGEDLTVVRGEGHVLVVAQDGALLDLLCSTLSLAGYGVDCERSGRVAATRLRDESFDLVVVDTSMPGLVHVPRQTLQQRGAAVLFLVASDRLASVVDEVGFSGDDYLRTPFLVSDLLARAHLLMRDSGAVLRRSVLVRGDLRLDDASYGAWRAGRALDLSPAEYRLLRELARNAGVVLSKEQIADRVWGEARDDNAIERLVSRLRRKVDLEPPALIRTQRGFGYSLVVTT
jgi:DNA-binding response OmpR family regulator